MVPGAGNREDALIYKAGHMLACCTVAIALVSCSTTKPDPVTSAQSTQLIITDPSLPSVGYSRSPAVVANNSQVQSAALFSKGLSNESITLDSVEVIALSDSSELVEVSDEAIAYDSVIETLQQPVLLQSESADSTTGTDRFITPAVTATSPPVSRVADGITTQPASPVISGGQFAALAYHRVGYDKSPYTVTPGIFAEHMQLLYEQGFNTLSLNDVADWLAGQSDLPPRSVLITIDDGHRSSYSEIHPVLQSFRFQAVYFPYSDYIDNGGLTGRMMRQMRNDGGVEFGQHTKTHAALTERGLNESRFDYRARVVNELAEPIVLIDSLVKPARLSIAYPYGKVDRVVEALVREQGIEMGFTVNCAMNSRNANPLRLNRCTVGRDDDQDMIFAKVTNPALALRRLAQLKQSGVSLAARGAPEFLGNLADREFFTGVPIEPFAPYFIDPDGDVLVYSAPGLPEGLTIDERSGLISGAPASATRISGLTIIATDQRGVVARTNAFDVTVH